MKLSDEKFEGFDATFETKVKTQDILKESSYLFYEMKDINKEIHFNKGDSYLGDSSETYIVPSFPLFSEEVLDAPFNKKLLALILDEAPFYHKEPEFIQNAKEDDEVLSYTRDISKIDVASVLQTPFWAFWFYELQGYFTDELLLSIFNELKYPFIDENQYLNADLFTELASKAFTLEEGSQDNNSNETNPIWQSLKFKTDLIDNQNDIDRGDYGCLDYLQKIINQKLKANLAIINYNPDQANLLSCWTESEYQRGNLLSSELEKEKTIYKLQDIQYELLRRKFAGSSTLYNISLASINRRGSFIRTVAIGDITDISSEKNFRDTRLARILNIPGILTSSSDITSLTPFESLYEVPASNNNDYIPMDLVNPLFYTSATKKDKPYNSDKFYGNDFQEKGDTLSSYRASYLRDNNNIIEWELPSSPLSNEKFNKIYPRLDTKVKDETGISEEIHYRKLDVPSYIVNNKVIPNILDYHTTVIDSTVMTGSVLDVSADTPLYHENTLQKKNRISYPYITSPIASGNSVSLMDTAWLNYLKNATEQKSKVSDNISFGVQTSFLGKYLADQKFENIYFALSYGDDYKEITEKYKDENDVEHEVIKKVYYNNIPDLPICSYDEYINGYYNEKGDFVKGHLLSPKYAYLWMIVQHANVENFEVNKQFLENSDVDKILISKITLRIDPEDQNNPYGDIPVEKLKEEDLYKELSKFNIGVLPFTYSNLKNDKLLKLRLGLYENKLYDDISDFNYSKAMYAFSDSDMISYASSDIMPDRTSLVNGTSLQDKPSLNTKSIYFILKRVEPKDENSTDLIDKYIWSEPVPVINLTHSFEFDNKYKVWPDWYGLCYHLNPELNYNENTASPLFNRDVVQAPFEEPIPDPETGEYKVTAHLAENFKGATQFTALSNLNRTRNAESLCNDSGTEESIYLEKLTEEDYGKESTIRDYEGFYLNYEHPYYKNSELKEVKTSNVDVYGDNRFRNILDGNTIVDSLTPSDSTFNTSVESSLQRSDAYLNSIFNKYCLHFDYPQYKASDPEVPFLYNYFELLPKKDVDSSTDWSRWWWNTDKCNDITVCFNIKPSGSILNTIIQSQIHKVVEDALKNNKAALEKGQPFSVATYDELLKDSFNYKMLLAERPSEFSLYLYFKVKNNLNASIADIIKDPTLENQLIGTGVTFKVGFKINNREELLSEKEYYIPYGFSSDSYRITASLYNEAVELKSNLYEYNTTQYLIINRDVKVVELQKKAKTPISLNKKDSQGAFLKEISLFSKVDKTNNWQTDIFYGDIFDFRLYGKGFSKENLILLNRGLIRELYSYSSSNMSLGYHIYKDQGIFKIKDRISSRSAIEKAGLPKVNTIRLFNRNKWNSLLVDLYPLSEEELDPTSIRYRVDVKDPLNDFDIFDIAIDKDTGLKKGILKDAIEQELDKLSEVHNGQAPTSSLSINYNNVNYPIAKEDLTTIVTTSLYPMNYKNHSFDSEAKLEIDETSSYIKTTLNNPIDLPVSPVKSSLEYQADLELNFEMDCSSDFSVWLDKGINITRLYEPSLNKSIAKLVDNKKRNSNNNHILLPLTLPLQPYIIDQNAEGYLDRFYLSHLTLNGGISQLLNATSYYNELRIPYPQFIDFKNVQYASKWDAIRSLKEGAYYITCKYPFQILPFTDDKFNMTTRDSNYTVYYGAVRFKVIVKGTPIEYDNSKYDLDYNNDVFPEKYLRNNIVNTLESEIGLMHPEDNRTFPHRKFDIDFYVMNNNLIVGHDEHSLENYTWDLIASNHKEDYLGETDVDYDHLIELNANILKKDICIEKKLPMFITKSFTTPYFISSAVNSSLSDDVIEPIKVKVFRTNEDLEEEKLTSEVESDLDNQVLISGRSYKILFDYDAKISEISFSDSKASTSNLYTIEGDKIHKETERNKIYKAERIDYSRMTSILDSVKLSNYSDFLYNGFSDWYIANDFNVTGLTSGFQSKNNIWEPIASTETTNPSQKKYFFGNPYSKSQESNYLYKIASDRQEVNNLAYFPYIASNVKNESILSGAYITNELPTLENNGKGTSLTLNYDLPISEDDILTKIWERMTSKAKKIFSQLTSNVGGIFTGLSSIRPYLIYEGSNGNILSDVKSNIDIPAGSTDLVAYYADDRNINVACNNIILKRASLYKNNLFVNQNFEDKTKWSLSERGNYEADSSYDVDNEGKDTYKISLQENKPLIMKYKAGTRIINTTYEIALVAQSNVNIQVSAIFYKNDNQVGEPLILTSKELAQNETTPYLIYEAETPESTEADAIGFKITYTPVEGIIPFVKIAKAIARIKDFYIHKLGFSNIINSVLNADNKVTILAHKIIAYKDSLTQELLPIQFYNNFPKRTIGGLESIAVNVNPYSITDFISNNALEEKTPSKKIIRLMEPWTRHIHYWEHYLDNNRVSHEDKVVISSYIIGKDNFGKLVKKIEPGESRDIYYDASFTYDGHSKITIDKINVIFNKDSEGNNILAKYNMNLRLNRNRQDSLKEGNFPPVVLSNENFSGNTNCFNLINLKEKIPSEVVVTNIQLLGESEKINEGDSVEKEILYELEYLPIIYDESKHHFSFNFFLYRNL